MATILDIDDGVHKTAQREAFITIKDHKENFENNPKCRLINPTKQELGKVSKKILEKINSRIKEITKLEQWKNTGEATTWFTNLRQKHSRIFIQFDIDGFYPNISEELLNEALAWAGTIVEISESDKRIIFQTKKSLLYHGNQAWTKKGQVLFDVTMGSYDGAEVCELVGLFRLHKLRENKVEDVGVYRDDGLAALKMTPRQMEQTKKTICRVFAEYGLKISIEKKNCKFFGRYI